MHYFFTSSSIWLYFEVLYIHYAVTAGRLAGRAFTCYIPVGWGIPAVVVGAVLAVDLNAYGADWRCWIAYDRNLIWAFICPILFFSAV